MGLILGVGLGIGDATPPTGDCVGEGDADGDGLTLGELAGVGLKTGDTTGVGLSRGDGDGLILGDGDGEATGVGVVVHAPEYQTINPLSVPLTLSNTSSWIVWSHWIGA